MAGVATGARVALTAESVGKSLDTLIQKARDRRALSAPAGGVAARFSQVEVQGVIAGELHALKLRGDIKGDVVMISGPTTRVKKGLPPWVPEAVYRRDVIPALVRISAIS